MNLANKTYSVRDNKGVYRSIPHDVLIDSAREAIISNFKKIGPTLSSPKAVRDHLTVLLSGLEHEVFSVLLVNAQNQFIHYEELFRGTIDGANVWPREVVKLVLQHNGASVVLVHNHPSSVCEPSEADHRITERLKNALGWIDVKVNDHLIVGGGDSISFAEKGWL